MNPDSNIKDALQYAVGLSHATTFEIGDKTYTDKPLTLVEYQPPLPAQFSVNISFRSTTRVGRSAW